MNLETPVERVETVESGGSVQGPVAHPIVREVGQATYDRWKRRGAFWDELPFLHRLNGRLPHMGDLELELALQLWDAIARYDLALEIAKEQYPDRVTPEDRDKLLPPYLDPMSPDERDKCRDSNYWGAVRRGEASDSCSLAFEHLRGMRKARPVLQDMLTRYSNCSLYLLPFPPPRAPNVLFHGPEGLELRSSLLLLGDLITKSAEDFNDADGLWAAESPYSLSDERLGAATTRSTGEYDYVRKPDEPDDALDLYEDGLREGELRRVGVNLTFVDCRKLTPGSVLGEVTPQLRLYDGDVAKRGECDERFLVLLNAEALTDSSELSPLIDLIGASDFPWTVVAEVNQETRNWLAPFVSKEFDRLFRKTVPLSLPTWVESLDHLLEELRFSPEEIRKNREIFDREVLPLFEQCDRRPRRIKETARLIRAAFEKDRFALNPDRLRDARRALGLQA